MRRAGAALRLLLALAWGLLGCRLDEGDWYAVKAGIAARFPGVPAITTERLAAWRADGDTVQPVLLDTRTPAEYAVSHLDGARRASTEAGALAILEGARTDTPVVTYCSVGYRSADLAARLQARGWTGVVNLEGSLFQWANEGRPLWRAGERVDVVHPYGRPWSGLLDEDRRASRAVIADFESR